MKRRPLKLEHALEVLPDVEDLLPVRDALIGASRVDQSKAWAGSEEYTTLDKRVASVEALEAQLPHLVERARERAERLYTHTVQALRALEKGEVAAAARELVSAGELEEGARRLEQAERYYARAAELGRKPRDRRVEGLARRRLGRVARALGDRERALQEYRRGYEIAEASRDVEGMVVGCVGLGNLYVDQGEWAAARTWYERGLELLNPEAHTRQRWELYSNLAIVARREGGLEQSAEWLHRATRVIDALGDAAGRAFVQNGWGRLHIARGEPSQAESTFRDALAAAEDPATRTYVLVNLAEALLLQNRLREAEDVAREAEELAIVRRVVAVLPEIYRLLGAVARERRDPQGFVFFEQALDLARSLDLPPVERAVTQLRYAQFEAQMGERDAALARLTEAREIYERLGAATELAEVDAELARLEPGDGEDTRRTSN